MEVDVQLEAASKAIKSFVVFRRFDTVRRVIGKINNYFRLLFVTVDCRDSLIQTSL